MARINIEDSLFKDSRFMKLYIKLQSVETALGALVRVWSVAQEYYLKDDRKIPRSVWDEQELNNEVLAVGLAYEVDGRISVEGADSQFSWLLQRVEAGRRGGQSKGKQDHNLSKEIQVQRAGARAVLSKAVSSGKILKPEHCSDCGATDCIIEGHHSDYLKPLEVIWLCKRCHTETHRNIRLATASPAEVPLADTKPSTLTLTHSLTKELNTNTNMRKSASDLLTKIERLYFEHYPLKKGKSKGVKTLSKQIKTEEDLKNLELAIKKYTASIKDPRFTQYFSTFANEWTDWLDPTAGQVEDKNKLDVKMGEEDFLKMINKGIL